VMFRVRLAEFVESAWLRDGTFMSESALARSEPSSGGAAPRRYHARRALNRFYARDFRGLLRYVSPPPVSDELEIFLAATAHEMLGQYEAARSYLEAIRPRRAEWPEALIALGARLDMRAGKIASAARDFASIVVVGPEDFGVNYCMGVVCLAYERRELARSYFLRAFTSYMVDTLDFQWAQLTTAVLEGSRSAA